MYQTHYATVFVIFIAIVSLFFCFVHVSGVGHKKELESIQLDLRGRKKYSIYCVELKITY
jgi:hypothetical protein